MASATRPTVLLQQPSKYLVSTFVGLAAGFLAFAGIVMGFGRGFLMTVRPVPDPAWTGEWAGDLVPAAAAQELALEGLLGVLIAVVLLAAAAAAVCGVLLMAVERMAATRSVAIYAALGIDRWRLTLGLVRGVRHRAMQAAGAAFCVVLSCGLAIRWTWPDEVLGWSWLDGALAVGAAMVAATAVLATALLPGLAIWTQERLYGFLSRQSPSLPDRGESFARDVAVVCQVVVAVSVLVLIGGLVGSSPDRARVDSLGEDTVAIPMEVAVATPGPSRARLYESLLSALAARPEVEAESIASAGALLGLGANGVVVAQCGECSIGGMYAPFSVLKADHHAVGPGFFRLIGYEIVSGREFTPTDVSGAERVAIVNRSFAERHFERGDPLGRGVQIGGPLGEWFDVVGVVDEPRAAAMGAQSSSRPALYLSAFQVPPARSTLIVQPSFSSTENIERLTGLIPSGVVSGPPRTLAAVRQMSWAPLLWMRRALSALTALAFFVVMMAVRSVMHLSVERAQGEIGLRMAVGATPSRITALVIRRAFNRLAWGTVVGLFLGLLLLGRLQRVIPEVSPPPMEWVLVWTSFLSLAALWGAWVPARQAARQDPARVLAEG